MTSFQWSITASRKALLDKLEEIPEFGKRSKSEIIELALEDFILKHGNSNNPQTKIELFQSELIKAIPTIYAKRKDFEKFYKLLSKEEYKELDSKINMIMEIHNGFLDRVH
ncbi:MAG: hypothetical protein V3U54_13460 [Thermodesulfobacteriota bacterium]